MNCLVTQMLIAERTWTATSAGATIGMSRRILICAASGREKQLDSRLSKREKDAAHDTRIGPITRRRSPPAGAGPPASGWYSA